MTVTFAITLLKLIFQEGQLCEKKQLRARKTCAMKLEMVTANEGKRKANLRWMHSFS